MRTGEGPLTMPLPVEQVDVTPHSRSIEEAVYFAEPFGLAYLRNPKVASSTIKMSLWKAIDHKRGVTTFRGNPHERKRRPFPRITGYDLEKLASAKFFTVVRNPYDRILAAYLDKIVAKQPPLPYQWFKRHFGKSDASFKEFVQLISSLPEAETNIHFRSQYWNIFYPHVRFDFIGRLENMAEVGAYLKSHGIDEVSTYSGVYSKKTEANKQLEYFYDREVRALVRARFAVDFDLWEGRLEPAEKTDLFEFMVPQVAKPSS